MMPCHVISCYDDSSPSLDFSATYLLDLKLEERVDSIASQHITSLWNDPGIQKTFKIRALFQLNDGCSYFFQHLGTVHMFGRLM